MRRHIIVLVTTVVIIIGTFAATLLTDNRPVLGLDLQGGVSIVLFPVEGSDLSALDAAVTIIRNRVDGLGIAEPEVNRQADTIVIDLPGVKDRRKAEELVGQTAELRFRLVSGYIPGPGATTTTTKPKKGATTTTTPATTTPATTTPATTPTTTTPTTAAAPPETQALGASSIQLISTARPAQAATTTAPDVTPTTPLTTTAPTGTATTIAGDAAPTTVAGDTASTTVPGATTPTTAPAASECEDVVTPRNEQQAEAQVVLPSGEPEGGCYALGPTLLTGKNVKTATARYESGGGGWLVDVEFRTDEFVTKVAGPYVNQTVAIELDGVVESAPRINPGITGKTVQISGSFSESEARQLALVLKYGSLPIQFDQNEQTVSSVSPSLGKDQLHAGIVAGVIGLALVALYMILYYRLLGLVVWLGLGLTALTFFTLVSYLSANSGLTLTLAGVTGIIVSVGVTVDSYVVYFERLKDEVRSGKTVRSSLESGFRRAFRTIWAADLVSLLGAVVLYVLASGSVRLFAYFLGISTVLDLILAYFFMHPLVVLLARRRSLVNARGVGIASALDVPEATA